MIVIDIELRVKLVIITWHGRTSSFRKWKCAHTSLSSLQSTRMNHSPFLENPPSTEITCPVMYPAAGVHKNATNEATSAGSPTLPSGVLSKTDLFHLKTHFFTIKNVSDPL